MVIFSDKFPVKAKGNEHDFKGFILSLIHI